MQAKIKIKARQRSLQEGASLVSVLMAVAIGAIVSTGITTVMSNGMKAQNSLSLKMDRVVIAQSLLASTSCSSTLPSTCTPGSLQALKRLSKTGAVTAIVSNSGLGTRFDRLAVRAECNATGDGLVLRAAYLKPTASITSTSESDFLLDPLTGKKYTWSDDQTKLYPTGIELCDGSSTGGGSGPPPTTGPNLSDCANINVPWNGSIFGSISSVACPANRPYFSGLVISQETAGNDSDVMKQIKCRS